MIQEIRLSKPALSDTFTSLQHIILSKSRLSDTNHLLMKPFPPARTSQRDEGVHGFCV